MKTVTTLLFVTILLAPCFAHAQQAKLKALIVDGQNNHRIWPKSTLMMRYYLHETGLFEVDVVRTAFTWRGEDYPEEYKGTGRHEPCLMTIDYGKGRVFHTTLGHWDYSLACVGFIVTFQRGAEWAATGSVTQGGVSPADFPTAETSSSRDFDRSEK